MKKILLHIGTSKTGSSSIQASLAFASNRGKLAPLSYFRPRVESNNFISCLYYPVADIPYYYQKKYCCSGELEKVINAYRQEFFSFLNAHDQAIVSAEALSNFGSAEISLLKEDLESAGFFLANVVMYVRDPLEHYLSRLQQSLKVSHRPVEPENYGYNLKNKIHNWQVHFPDGMIVRPFQRMMLNENCVVADFLHLASRFFSTDLKSLRVFNVNESVSAEGMFILQQYRAMFYPDADHTQQPDVNRLVALLQQSKELLCQSRARLKTPVAMVMRKNYSEVYCWLRRRHGIVFPSFSKEIVSNLNHIATTNKGGGGLEEFIFSPGDYKINVTLLQVIKMLYEKENERLVPEQ